MLPFRSAILDAMKALSNSSSNKPCNHIKTELKRIRGELNQEVLDVSEGLRRYTELVDSYYSQCHPFGSGKFESDYQDFIELVGHSLVIGNYFLLEKWAIRYPIENPTCLAQPLPKYISTFNSVTTTQWEQISQQLKWPSQARVYCEYLVKNWNLVIN
jgi:hypothetical protein